MHGRIETTTHGPGGAGDHTTTFAYDSITGRLDSITDPASRTTTFDTYDDAGRVEQISDKSANDLHELAIGIHQIYRITQCIAVEIRIPARKADAGQGGNIGDISFGAATGAAIGAAVGGATGAAVSVRVFTLLQTTALRAAGSSAV